MSDYTDQYGREIKSDKCAGQPYSAARVKTRGQELVDEALRAASLGLTYGAYKAGAAPFYGRGEETGSKIADGTVLPRRKGWISVKS